MATRTPKDPPGGLKVRNKSPDQRRLCLDFSHALFNGIQILFNLDRNPCGCKERVGECFTKLGDLIAQDDQKRAMKDKEAG